MYIFQCICFQHSELWIDLYEPKEYKQQHVTGPQQKPLQAFEKLIHSL